MQITINGNKQNIPSPLTVLELLTQQGLDPSKVVVEHNTTILKAEAFAQTPINDGDSLELLQFVGGG